MVTEILSLTRRFDVRDDRDPLLQGILAELSACSVPVAHATNVPEGEAPLQKALMTALNRADVIIAVGGLGPRTGDLLKRTLCRGLGRPLSLHLPTLERMKEFYCLAGRSVPDDGELWCSMPQGARVLLNPVGYLSGFALTTAEQAIICLPDSPPELYAMLGREVYPLLGEFTKRFTSQREFYTYGLDTWELWERLEGVNVSPYTGFSAHAFAGSGTVRLVGQPVELSVLAKKVQTLLGNDCYSIDPDRSLLEVTSDLCREREWRLGVAEMGMGLLFSRSLTPPNDAPSPVAETVVASTPKARQQLGLDEKEAQAYGVCSHEVTLSMAIGAARLTDCTVGVAITRPRLEEKQRAAGGLEPPVYYAVCLNGKTWWGQVEPCPDQKLTAVLEVANLLRLLALEDAATLERGVPAAAALLPPGEQPPPPRSGGILPRRRDPIGEQVRKVVFLLALVVLVASSGYLGWTRYTDYKNQQQNKEIGSLIKDPETIDAESSNTILPEGYLPQFEELYLINDHLAGYLEIAGTDFAFPVVQYGDNEYYLNRDFYRKENRHGVPFADYRTHLERPDRNTIIYGHNLRDNQMFAELTRYKDLEYYRSHPTITFNSVYEEGEYKVLAVFLTNTREQDGPIFDYLAFLNGTEEEFAQYVAEVTARSLVQTPVDVRAGDTLLTLSTCTYEFTDARFVVVARKVRLGEDPSVDVESATRNEDPLLPRVWYNLYGGWQPEDPAYTQVVDASGKVIPASPTLDEEAAPPPSSQSTPSKEPPAPPKEPDPPPVETTPTPPPVETPPEETPEEEIPEETPPEEEVPEEDPPEEDPEEDPPSNPLDETLYVTAGGRRVELDAREMLGRIVQNETGGNFEMEALKAHAVATYSYLKYNNQRNIAPSVVLKSSVSSKVYQAVDAVLGKACYYKGSIINATYHSVSCGATASAQSVWGGSNYPYLVSVDSPWDSKSPYYGGSYSISASDFADRVWDTYHIDLYEYSDDPGDWVDIRSHTDGGYVGTVSLGGSTKSKGGSVSSGTTITGRGIRESLLGFKLRSTCFEVTYKSSSDQLTFTTEGYGHGVGMSQWGAHYMAQDGADYREILEHYYTGITVR